MIKLDDELIDHLLADGAITPAEAKKLRNQAKLGRGRPKKPPTIKCYGIDSKGRRKLAINPKDYATISPRVREIGRRYLELIREGKKPGYAVAIIERETGTRKRQGLSRSVIREYEQTYRYWLHVQRFWKDYI